MARSMTKAKGTSKAETPTAPVEEVVEAVEVKEVPVKEEVKEVKPTKREFKETDGILCRSVTSGGLYMVGKKTGMLYEWNAYGHEYEVEYRDLVIAVRTRSDFVFGPLFIIEDEEFIEQFPIVKKFYDDSYSASDLAKILNLPIPEMEREIAALPPSAKKNFQSVASTAVREGRLDSLKKIDTIDEIFDIDLRLLSTMQ